MGRAATKSQGLKPAPAGQPVPALPLYLMALLVGLVSLCLEMTLVRLISPYFGATLYTWGAAITTIVLCMAAGNVVGGELCVRPLLSKEKAAAWLLILSGGYQLTVPLWGPGFLDFLSTRVFLFSASALKVNAVLFFVSVLLAGPSLVLACATSPVVFGLLAAEHPHPGRLAGRLMALGTLGSCLGVLLANYVGATLLGVKWSLLATAGLTLLGAVLVPRPGVLRATGAAGVLLAFLLIRPLAAPLKNKVTTTPKATVVEEVETPYVYAQVFDMGVFRYIGVNDGLYAYTKKMISPGAFYPFYTSSYWDTAMASVMAHPNPRVRRALVLGFAGGISYQLLKDHFPDAKVEAVEIDPVYERLAREYFNVTPDPGTLHIGDARPLLKTLRGPYDLIVLDVYQQSTIPFYLVTRECFAQLAKLTGPQGVLAFNFATPGKDNAYLNRVLASLKPGYPHVWLAPVEKSANLIVIASRAPLDPRGAMPRAMTFWKDKDALSRRYLAQVSAGVAKAQPADAHGAKPLTDDFSPSEWLGLQASSHYFSEMEKLRKKFRGKAKS